MFPRRPSPRGSELSALSSIAPFRRALARRSSRPRDGSRFLHRQALGFDRQVIFAYCDELRECPNSVLGRSRIHLVAGLESPHARSDSDYDACQLVTENERQSITQEQLEFSVSDLRIQWVHASSVDLDQDVILPHFRVWNFTGPHAICASIALDDECFHVALLSTIAYFSRTGVRGSDAIGASSRRSFRMPASTNPAGANLRSNRRRFASPPAA